MAFFKSNEEKQKEDEKTLKKMENRILNGEEYYGLVGRTHTGWNFIDGFRNADKTKFKRTKFKISDDKLIIERNKQVIQLSNLREIFQDNDYEAIILLNNGKGIPIRRVSSDNISHIKFKGFLNVLNMFVEKNKTNTNNIKTNTNNQQKSEDKYDKLIKLGEMHNQGLLSNEEFTSLKQELLARNNENTTPESDNEPSNTTCGNCGAEISSNDSFCSECGTKIN